MDTIQQSELTHPPGGSIFGNIQPVEECRQDYLQLSEQISKIKIEQLAAESEVAMLKRKVSDQQYVLVQAQKIVSTLVGGKHSFGDCLTIVNRPTRNSADEAQLIDEMAKEKAPRLYRRESR